jgi:hypothetical protein
MFLFIVAAIICTVPLGKLLKEQARTGKQDLKRRTDIVNRIVLPTD